MTATVVSSFFDYEVTNKVIYIFLESSFKHFISLYD